MTKYLNTRYWKEKKNMIIDYTIKLNLEYFMYKDFKSILSRSEFTKLCKSGFFIRYFLNNNRNNPYWKICENEKPIKIVELSFKR